MWASQHTVAAAQHILMAMQINSMLKQLAMHELSKKVTKSVSADSSTCNPELGGAMTMLPRLAGFPPYRAPNLALLRIPCNKLDLHSRTCKARPADRGTHVLRASIFSEQLCLLSDLHLVQVPSFLQVHWQNWAAHWAQRLSRL